VFLVSHLHWYGQPNKNDQETEHTNNTMQNVAPVNSTTDKLKKTRLRERTDKAWFSSLFTTPGQEMERVYSFNPGARMGQRECSRMNTSHKGRATPPPNMWNGDPVNYLCIVPADIQSKVHSKAVQDQHAICCYGAGHI